ncbi:MAG: type I 3-dehydroquinate dehydratase [Candidatus Bathyarchaeia archaeon]
MKPRICVSIPLERSSELSSLIRRAQDAGADFIEVRLDYLKGEILTKMNSIEKAILNASVPLIATNRKYEQGGRRPQNEETRIVTLTKAAEIGFQYVDIELSSENLKVIVKRIRDLGSKPILSFHDFKGTPSDSEMEKIMKMQLESGAEVCKIVTTANTLEDNIKCLLFTQKMSQVMNIVCFAMGSKGILSRVLSPLFGSFFTFSSLEPKLETASGQFSISELKEIYKKLGVIS